MITSARRFVSLPLLAALLSVVLVATPAQAATEVSSWQDLHDAFAQGGVVVAQADISGGRITAPQGVPVTLDLNGYDLMLEGRPAVRVEGKANLTIKDSKGTGSLTAKGESPAAGIGGGHYSGVGSITITGGTVTATAASGGAGIGGGFHSDGGSVTITGGTVTATGASGGAGIGGGHSGDGGSVTITGGTVTATGNFSSAGIGGGRYGEGGSVKVTGGAVTATGGTDGAGIGGGEQGAGATVTITGGTVTAEGGYSSIGAGASAQSGELLAPGTLTVSGKPATLQPLTAAGGNPAVVTVVSQHVSYGDFNVTNGLTENSRHQTRIEYGVPLILDAIGGDPTLRVQMVVPGKAAVKPSDPTRTGYTFTGWQLDGKAYDFGTAVTRPITLTATWKLNTYSVTFDANGGSTVGGKSVEHGKALAKPADPTRPGYTFTGWQLDGKAYNFANAVTKPITLKATWKLNTYSVTFDANGGSAVSTQTVNHGSKVSEPTAPTRPGYTFTGWQLAGEPYNFATAVTKPVTLKATWKPHTYTVSFDTNGGSAVSTRTVNHGSKVSEPKTPTRTGYTFTGWQLDGKSYDFTSPATGPLKLSAQWDRAVVPVNLVDVSSDRGSKYYTQFHKEITWLANEGITRGWNVGGGKYEFRPKQEITREAMAAFMYRYAGSPDVKLPAKSPFKDVTPQNTNFYKEIVWMNQQGISTGWSTSSGKEFRPKDEITRDAMAAFMYRFADKPAFKAPATSPFADVPKSSQFYKEITWLANAGISTGWTQPKGKPEYRPYDEISREAMAAFLYRLDRL